MNDLQRPTAAILDEYCRYYSDFSKILNIYIKTLHPQLNFEFDQLLNASYNVWHQLNDEEKISLGTFLDEINQDVSPAINNNNNNSNSIPIEEKKKWLTPYHIFLKDERRKLVEKHSNMSLKDINKRLSERWKKLSKRMKNKYQYRSYLAKKRFYQKTGQNIQLKKPSFIRKSIK